MNGDPKVVKQLIEVSDIHATDRDKRTALHLSAKNQKMDAAIMLICAGCRLDDQDQNGNTALHLAVANRQLDVVFELVNRGADKSAKNNSKEDALTILIEDLVKFGDSGAKNELRSTPLHVAICEGKLKLALALIALGFDNETKDKDGRTPLHIAATGINSAPSNLKLAGYGEGDNLASELLNEVLLVQPIISLLIETGADKEAKDNNGQTPLHLGATKGKAELVRILVNCAT
jgi:ankyrin repeat protein